MLESYTTKIHEHSKLITSICWNVWLLYWTEIWLPLQNHHDQMEIQFYGWFQWEKKMLVETQCKNLQDDMLLFSMVSGLFTEHIDMFLCKPVLVWRNDLKEFLFFYYYYYYFFISLCFYWSNWICKRRWETKIDSTHVWIEKN